MKKKVIQQERLQELDTTELERERFLCQKILRYMIVYLPMESRR